MVVCRVRKGNGRGGKGRSRAVNGVKRVCVEGSYGIVLGQEREGREWGRF